MSGFESMDNILGGLGRSYTGWEVRKAPQPVSTLRDIVLEQTAQTRQTYLHSLNCHERKRNGAWGDTVARGTTNPRLEGGYRFQAETLVYALDKNRSDILRVMTSAREKVHPKQESGNSLGSI